MMDRSKRLGLRLALAGFLLTLARPGRTDGTYNTYVNTPWYTVVSTPPPSEPGANHQYVLAAVPTPVDDETGLPLTHFAGFSLNVRGDNRALEKDGLFIACRVHELPLGRPPQDLRRRGAPRPLFPEARMRAAAAHLLLPQALCGQAGERALPAGANQVRGRLAHDRAGDVRGHHLLGGVTHRPRPADGAGLTPAVRSRSLRG